MGGTEPGIFTEGGENRNFHLNRENNHQGNQNRTGHRTAKGMGSRF